jgi:glycosyltransferase involved in cell wall biosynthesis
VLKVLLDATAVPQDRRGVGRYVDSLIPALARAGAQVRVICQASEARHYGALSGESAIAAPAWARRRPARLAWEQTGLAWAARTARLTEADLLHSPHYTFPVLASLGRLPLVVTLHDATFFSDAAVHTTVKGPFFRTATRLALRRADQCVVPSAATAAELVRHAGADPTRLTVAHLGVDASVFAPPTVAAVERARARLGLAPDANYLAFLGTMEPRKNLPALIRGWVRAFATLPQPPASTRTGGSGWDTELEAAARSVPAGLRLLRPGYLPLSDLAGFLGGAELVVYPSLGEGFGLPVLEAMACRAAVLTTRRLALPEVGGDAVAYCEPSAESIASALVELCGDEARRGRLQSAGLARSAMFSWDACAESHLTAYERATAGARR